MDLILLRPTIIEPYFFFWAHEKISINVQTVRTFFGVKRQEEKVENSQNYSY